MHELSDNRLSLHYVLRVASAMCFIGHGSFGLISKAIWCNYFAVFGIGTSMAYSMMPYVGGIDILMGIILLVYPIRVIPAWLVIWGFATALLRPLSGEPFAEFLERGGNFGAPLALLLTAGGVTSFRMLFTPIRPGQKMTESQIRNVRICLRIVVFLLLLGHGWLNLIDKPALLQQYTRLGFSDPGATARIVGSGEIIAAVAVLIRPWRPLLFMFLIWKMGSELFYPHYEILEWVERGGSYGTLLALFLLTERMPFPRFHRTLVSPSG